MDEGPLNFKVRVAGRNDDIAIAQIRSLWTGVNSDAVFESRLSQWLTDEGDRRTTWLAWAGQNAIGMASLFEYRRMPRPGRDDSRWGYLSNMFVRDEFARVRLTLRASARLDGGGGGRLLRSALPMVSKSRP